MPDTDIHHLKGKEILPYLTELAHLRMTVFKEYPYLYEGDLAYEEKYLQTYADCNESIMVLAINAKQIIGASTAIPLTFETEEVKQPFQDQKMDIEEVFYFGESILLPKYRGHGIYRHFFLERERAAKAYGSTIAAFCAVERPSDDPKKPINYQPLDPVWRHFGYSKHPQLRAYFEWKETGESNPSTKPLVFWLKTLER